MSFKPVDLDWAQAELARCYESFERDAPEWVRCFPLDDIADMITELRGLRAKTATPPAKREE